MTVLARGRSIEGDDWQLLVKDRPGLNGVVTATSIRVVSAVGRVTQGGYANRTLKPGERLDFSGGQDDQDGPRHLILRVARDVASIRVQLSDGRLEQPELVYHPVHQDAQVAGLVFPRALDVTSVEILDSAGTVMAAESNLYLFDRPGLPR